MYKDRSVEFYTFIAKAIQISLTAALDGNEVNIFDIIRSSMKDCNGHQDTTGNGKILKQLHEPQRYSNITMELPKRLQKATSIQGVFTINESKTRHYTSSGDTFGTKIQPGSERIQYHTQRSINTRRRVSIVY